MKFTDFKVKEVVGVVHYSPKIKSWTARNRKEHIVGIQLSGSAIHTFANQKFTISDSCIYFLNKKDDYDVEVIEPTDAFSIHFTAYEDIDTDSFCLSVPNPQSFVSILQKAEISKLSGNELTLLSMLYLFCAEVERAREKSYSRKDGRIIEAKKYIDGHFREKSCITEAIRISGISERRFHTLYKNAYGVTAGKYILNLKVELAKNLLSVGAPSVSEIADLCGFFDIYHFSKVFKNATGVSPTKYADNFKTVALPSTRASIN